jgi:hypothetical protein
LGKRRMIDRKTMRSLLEKMERAAEETLQQDSAFYEAVQALKGEIDNDPEVQATVSELQAAGRRVFSSFVPHIKIRVRTEEGIFALPKPAAPRLAQVEVAPVERVGRLAQELRNAASAVIKRSRYLRALDNIVNEAVGASDRFEGIAGEVESAGHEVLICLDLSAYVEVQGAAGRPSREWDAKAQRRGREAVPNRPGTQPSGMQLSGMQLSGKDRKFLKDLGISVEGS